MAQLACWLLRRDIHGSRNRSFVGVVVMRDWYDLGDYLSWGNIYRPYDNEEREYRVTSYKPPVYDVAVKIEEILDAVPRLRKTPSRK